MLILFECKGIEVKVATRSDVEKFGTPYVQKYIDLQ